MTAGESGNQSHPHLHIDLNVPDEGIVEDGLITRVTSSELASISGHDFVLSTRELSAPSGSASVGMLDLYLNHVEECEDTRPVTRHAEV